MAMEGAGVGVNSQPDQATAECDRFYFPDFSKFEVAPISDVDPLSLKKFKSKFVKLEGWNAVDHFGRVYTIDPVSLCVVLGRRRIPGGPVEIELIMGHIIKMMKISEDHPWSSLISADELDDLFSNKMNTEEVFTPTQSETIEIVQEPEYSKENLLKRKEAVKAWLKKNLLPVNERGELLVVAGGVTISPPYKSVSCSSGNEIIQNKIGKILNLMQESD